MTFFFLISNCYYYYYNAWYLKWLSYIYILSVTWLCQSYNTVKCNLSVFFISSLALLFHLTIAMHWVEIIIIKLCPQTYWILLGSFPYWCFILLGRTCTILQTALLITTLPLGAEHVWASLCTSNVYAIVICPILINPHCSLDIHKNALTTP